VGTSLLAAHSLQHIPPHVASTRVSSKEGDEVLMITAYMKAITRYAGTLTLCVGTYQLQ
jgi:hypothetical protein